LLPSNLGVWFAKALLEIENCQRSERQVLLRSLGVLDNKPSLKLVYLWLKLDPRLERLDALRQMVQGLLDEFLAVLGEHFLMKEYMAPLPIELTPLSIAGAAIAGG
jgi:hypothetical protein